MAKIGIFWVYQDTVIGKAEDLEHGVEGVPGLIDSNANHVDVWEEQHQFCNQFPELYGMEYQEIPRGRVLFLRMEGRALVYADKTLMNAETKRLISAFFEFELDSAVWRPDFHYTTSHSDLEDLFCE